MNGEIYRGVVVPAREAADGETPAAYCVTKETNGYAIWFGSFDTAATLIELEPYRQRDQVIERAVELTLSARAARAANKPWQPCRRA